MQEIRTQGWGHRAFYIAFGILSAGLLVYYLSDTLVHFTTPRQFPINSFVRLPLTILIFSAEMFSLLFAVYFVYTLLTDKRDGDKPQPLPRRDKTRVAVLVPIYNEPREIVERTIAAVRKLKWKGGVSLYLLDDSKDSPFIRDMDSIAEKNGCGHACIGNKCPMDGNCMFIRRVGREGFKAGNINNAVKNHVKEDFFVILDSDQAPLSNFLEETMDYFSDGKVGFVQTPQYFVNDSTPLERAEKVGANIFFHAQTVSKARDGAMPFCGTNAVVRKQAFLDVGGLAYYTSTEDIDLGIRMNDAGYYGAYVPKILVHGYGPVDYKAYSSQQYRWANGNLAILRESFWKILLSRRFSLRYQIHTLFTLGWWFIGFSTFLFIFVPIVSLLTGIGTHHTWMPDWMVVALYVTVLMGISMIYVSLHNRLDRDKVRFSDALLEYSLITNSMFIYMKAAGNALLRRYVGFVRTDKNGSTSGLGNVKWNLALASVCFGLSIYSLYNGITASGIQGIRTFIPVSIWLLFYSLVLASSIMFVGKAQPLPVDVPASRKETWVERYKVRTGNTT